MSTDWIEEAKFLDWVRWRQKRSKVLEVNAWDYAKRTGIDREVLRKTVDSMVERNLLRMPLPFSVSNGRDMIPAPQISDENYPVALASDGEVYADVMLRKLRKEQLEQHEAAEKERAMGDAFQRRSLLQMEMNAKREREQREEKKHREFLDTLESINKNTEQPKKRWYRTATFWFAAALGFVATVSTIFGIALKDIWKWMHPN